MTRTRKAFGLLLVILLLFPPLARAQGAIRFGSTSAVGHFPEEIVFSVTADGDAEIVKLELSYRVTGSPYTNSRWPDMEPARHVETTLRLDTQVEHYAPGSEFHYYWTATDSAGNVVDSDEQTFVYEDDRFNWDTVSTDRVAVFWYEGEQSFGQAVLDTASRALDRLEKDAGAQAQQQVRIYLYSNESDFRGALGPNSPEWIGGQALPPLGIIVAYMDPDPANSEIGRMIPHELSHVVLYQATSNPYAGNPNWFEEGIAVHNQEVADTSYPFMVEQAARSGELIPLRALSASFPSDPDQALLSYAESNSVIEFILSKYGSDGLSRLVSTFAEGETAEGAVQKALGVSLEELQAQWWDTLPAAETTPAPRTQAPSLPSPTVSPNYEPLFRVVIGMLACLAVLVIAGVVVVVILARRRKPAPPA